LSETGIESAITLGVSEAEVRDWCHGTLSKVFGDESQQVMFDSYAVLIDAPTPHPDTVTATNAVLFRPP